MPPKRKAISELSDNPHTAKSRNRLNNRNQFEIQIEKAKASDQAAITYRLRKVRRSQEWIQANEDERTGIKERVKHEVIHKRKVTGVHASIVAQRLGYGEDGGEFAQFDDGNSNFEDCEEENEVIQERLWKEDDEMNGETIISIEGNRDEQGVRLLDHGYEKQRLIEFRTWQQSWQIAVTKFEAKCEMLNLRGMEYLVSLGPHIDCEEGQYYDVIPPHRFFTTNEITVWRNLRMIFDGDCEGDDSDWVQLPGPADWYPDTYDVEKHGFFEPQERKKELYQEALELLSFPEKRVPREYQRVNLVCGELRMMNTTELLFKFDS